MGEGRWEKVPTSGDEVPEDDEVPGLVEEEVQEEFQKAEGLGTPISFGSEHTKELSNTSVVGIKPPQKKGVKLLTPGEALIAEKRKILEADTSEEDEDGVSRPKFGAGLHLRASPQGESSWKGQGL